MKNQLIPKFVLSLMSVMLILAALPAIPVHAATYTATNTGNWNSAATWGGAGVPGSTDDVTINSGVTVTVISGFTAACKSINFTQGTAGASSITLADSTSSLTVSGAVTIQEQASGVNVNQINIGAGTFSAASVALLATTDASRFSQILISTGTANISGNITSSGTASRITFSGSGRLNAGGDFLSGTAGTFTASTSTVNFNATGAQTVGAYTFNNLILSGSGLKSMPSGASVTGNLNISGSAKASVATDQNLSVGTLTLGGLGTANGTWGSTSSSASNQTDTFFDATTGYLTVATDTRTPQNSLVVTGPSSITYGSTGTITYTGGSGTGVMSYSHGSSTGCTVNSSTGVITVTNVPGSCTVTVTKAADRNYLASTSDGFGVTLNRLAVTLFGSRAYDTTAVAAAGILSITNKVVADDVTVASGSATLASANVGTQPITSMGNLALGGTAAANYTLSGASGSVTIGKADQIPMFVTGPASITYGTTGTITYTGGCGMGALSYSQAASTGCTVNSSTGEITVTDASGSCTVTATKAADINYNSITSPGFPITLNPLVAILTGSRAYDTTAVAAAGILSIANKVGADDVIVASGSATLASANVGTQSITSMGSLTLGGVAAANYTLSGASGSVTIGKANQTITFTQPTSPATFNSTFTVSPTSSSGLAVTVTASGVCYILGSSVTMTSGTGICSLTASQAGDTNYNPASNVVRTVTAQKANQSITFVSPASPATYNSTFTVSPTSSSGLAVTVTPSGVCTILGSTVTMTSGTGTCTLTASQAGDTNYNSASNEVRTVIAQKANQTITFAAPASPAAYNSSFTVSPTSDSGLAVSVTPSGVCTILGSTVTMTSGTGTCTLTASQAGNANFNSASNVLQTVTAQKANQSITFTAPASPAAYHSTFTVAPTSDSGLTVTVTPSGVCTILGSTVTMTSGAGTCTLTASQAGNTNYNPASNVVRTVTAQKANQTITFASPASPAAYQSTFTVAPTSDSGLAVSVTPSGVCTILGSTVTMTNGTGTCSLTASQAGDTNYNPAVNVVRTVTAQKANQTITFAAPASPAAYQSMFTVSPTSSSGLAVTVTASGVCTILGNTITMTSGAGTCSLTASQAGDTNYNPASDVVRTVTAQKANQTITFTAPASPAAYHSTFTVAPTSSSGLAVTVTPSGACTILGSTVTMTSGTGTCTLTASQAGDTDFNPASNVVRTVTAQKANQTITFPAPPSPNIYQNTFTVTPTSDSGLAVTVTASGACTILGSTVTMTSGTGTCTLTASQAGDDNYNPASIVVRTVTAQKANQSITFPAPVSPAAYHSTFTVSPTADSGLAVTVTPSGVCTILGSTVTMTSGTGTCTLTASQAGNDNYNPAISVVRTVTAQKANQSITFTAPVSPAAYLSTFTVAPTSDSSLAVTVTASGVCTILGSTVTMTSGTGTCTLTASQAGDDNYYPASNVVRTVTAQKANQTITFAAPASPVTFNNSFTVAPTSSSGLAVTVTPSGVCTILGSTVTMTSGTGTCTLTASQAGDTNYNPASNVVRTVTAQKANQAITFPAPASPATYNSTFTVAPTSNSGLAVTVTPSGVCSILGSTVTMTSGTGTCTLTASQAGDDNYNPASNVVRTVTAQKANQAITFPAPASPAAYNSSFTVSPTSDSGLAVTVTPSGVCTILGSTVTMTSGAGTCTLTASQAGDSNYNPASNVVRTVTAQKANQTITFPTPASPAAYNSTFTVAPTSDSGLTVTVTPSGVCSILGSTVTMNSGTGTCTLTASQAGNANYNPASDVVRTVTAQKANQMPLTVTGPASVTYGTTGTITYVGGSGSGEVSFSNSSSTGCTADSSTGVITVTNASGNCIVIVMKAEDSNFYVATSAGSVTLNKATQATLTVTGPANATYGTNVTITASGGSGNGALSYSQGSSTGCIVNTSTGLLTVTNVTLTCTVTATKAADNNYLVTTSAGFGVTLHKAAGSVSISNIPVSGIYGKSFTPTFTKLGDGMTYVGSLSPGICTVGGIVVNFVNLGTCTLQALVLEGTNHLAATGSLQSFEIKQAIRIYMLPIMR